MPQPRRISVSDCIRLYVDEYWSLEMVGRALNCTGSAVGKRLIAAGITLRTPGEGVKARRIRVPVPLCSVPACGRPNESHGLCNVHARRLRERGTTDPQRPISPRDGRRREALYGTWKNMRERCRNPRHPDYRLYGARGIHVCEAWDDFRVFAAYVGERPRGMTLDRIDNDRGYEPGNVRWATPKEQRANQRGSARVC